MRPFLLAWLVLTVPLFGETVVPEYFRAGETELELRRSPPLKIFISLTRREGAQPAEILAAGAELKGNDSVAESDDWRLELNPDTAGLTAKGGEPKAYGRELPEARLAAAKARAEKADTELNRVYGEAKAHLTGNRGVALRDSQREWIHFTYGESPQAPDAAEWLRRGDLAAERLRFLQGFAAEPNPLLAQLGAAEKSEEWPAVAEIARRLLVASPRDESLWEKRSRALVELEDWAHAAATLEEWQHAVPKPSAVLDELRGEVADGQDDTESAIRAWTAAAGAAPKNTDVRDKLAASPRRAGPLAGSRERARTAAED